MLFDNWPDTSLHLLLLQSSMNNQSSDLKRTKNVSLGFDSNLTNVSIEPARGQKASFRVKLGGVDFTLVTRQEHDGSIHVWRSRRSLKMKRNDVGMHLNILDFLSSQFCLVRALKVLSLIIMVRLNVFILDKIDLTDNYWLNDYVQGTRGPM